MTFKQLSLFLISNFLFLISNSSCKFRQKVSLIVHHGSIYTVDKNFAVQQAMAINDGKIIAVGSNDDILKMYEADEIKDLGGKTVYPGFIDAHEWPQSIEIMGCLFKNDKPEISISRPVYSNYF